MHLDRLLIALALLALAVPAGAHLAAAIGLAALGIAAAHTTAVLATTGGVLLARAIPVISRPAITHLAGVRAARLITGAA